MNGQDPISGLRDSAQFKKFPHLGSLSTVLVHVHGKHHGHSTRATTGNAHIGALSIGVSRVHIMCKSFNGLVPEVN
jgi:hypothetical protein